MSAEKKPDPLRQAIEAYNRRVKRNTVTLIADTQTPAARAMNAWLRGAGQEAEIEVDASELMGLPPAPRRTLDEEESDD